MTVTTTCLLIVFGLYALADWYAVEVGNRRLEYLCKPTALVALVWAAWALNPDDSGVQVAFVIGLVLSLAGDVFLMLPTDRFVFGLGSFLLAHVAYIVGFLLAGPEPLLLVAGVVLVAVLVALVGRRLLTAVRRGDTPELFGPVVAYVTAISVMVVTAIGTGDPVAIAGALFFYASDSLIGWNRFVRPLPHRDLAVMSTYHTAQFLLVLSLL